MWRTTFGKIPAMRSTNRDRVTIVFKIVDVFWKKVFRNRSVCEQYLPSGSVRLKVTLIIDSFYDGRSRPSSVSFAFFRAYVNNTFYGTSVPHARARLIRRTIFRRFVVVYAIIVQTRQIRPE